MRGGAIGVSWAIRMPSSRAEGGVGWDGTDGWREGGREVRFWEGGKDVPGMGWDVSGMM